MTLVYSNSLEDRVKNLKRMFERLDSLGLMLNPNKCKLCKSETGFLGHTISAGEANVMKNIVEAVQQALSPKNSEGTEIFPGFGVLL